MGPAAAWNDFTFSARDGLRLYARRYPAPGSHLRPVLCLPGLTRNSRDFHDIAMALSSGERARAVYALDSRGRGSSQYDRDWRNYAVPIEMLDVEDLVTLLGLESPAIIGTSRGGLVAMVLAAAQPTAVGAVVLNDIGPVIERGGLIRIAGYVGSMPLPSSWEDAANMVAEMNRRAFPAVRQDQWAEIARQWFNEANGRPAPGYDPNLARSFSVTDGPIPALWPQFMALARVPLLVIRAENSDILSAATVQQMRARHPQCASLTVAGQGHAPLLKDAETIAAIAGFLADVDAGRPVAGDLGRAA
ncbi:MAG: alpha/beta hydrolase [Hyphomicrobiaceae bacterium]|nr:alpha/beta hydrolase [Hyphomicrobiaceae bacterium]